MRLLPRFRLSLRTLLLLVSLVAGYFGLWELTKRFGVEHFVGQRRWTRSTTPPSIRYGIISPAPLLVSVDNLGTTKVSLTRIGDGNLGVQMAGDRDYHLWFFGLTCELPWHGKWVRTLDEPNVRPMPYK